MLTKNLFTLLCLTGMVAMTAEQSLAARVWQLQTKLNTAGGTLKVQRSDTPLQTVVGSTVFKNYTTRQQVVVTVASSAGYTISGVTQNGVTTNPGTSTYAVANVNDLTRLTNSLIINFAKQQLGVTTVPATGGTVSASASVGYGGSLVVAVTPASTAGIVNAIAVSPSSGSVVALKDSAGNPVSLPFAGAVKVNLSNVTAATTITPAFITATANAGADLFAVPGAVVTLSGTSSAGDAVAWVQESGPSVALTNATTLAPSFTPSATGTYGFKLQVFYGGKLLTSDTAQVSVSDSWADQMRSSCQGCHTGSGMTDSSFVNWSASSHKTASQTCVTCHTPNYHAVVTTASVDGSTFEIKLSTAGTVGTLFCAKCHVSGSNHKTTGMACTTCHTNGIHNPDTTVDMTKCSSCHTAPTDFAASIHATNPYHQLACADCHASLEAHNQVVKSAADSCVACHAPYAGEIIANYTKSTHNTGHGSYYGMQLSAKGCATCHNPHTTAVTMTDGKTDSCGTCHHTRNEGLANYVNYGIYTTNNGPMKAPHGGGTVLVKAQYVSAAGNNCADCHNHNNVINSEYGESSHGNVTGEAWWHYDWLSSSRLACARCHSTTGYINDLTGVTTVATPGLPGQVLACNGCHSNVEKGTLQTAGAYTLAASNGATAAYPNVAGSNLCVRCHGARETGDSIKLSTGNFADLSFINSHYLAAAGTLFTAAGYEYAGQSYDSLGYHKNVGVADAYDTGTAGPCVSCHMKSGQTGHTWEVVTTDATTGAITGVGSTMCANCHGGLTGAHLEAAKEHFHVALEALRTALFAKGIEFKPAYPYIYIAGTSTAFKNWDAVYPGKGKDVMGAAFNYNLVEHDPGAYAHNKQYALKLIADSCDFLADGIVDGAGVPAAVTTAQTSMEFAEATSHPAPIVAVTTSTNCGSCHVPSPHYGGQAFHEAQYVSTTVSCADCHGDPVSTTAHQPILVQYAESAHGDPAGEAWRHFDWRSGSRTSCARCHTGTAFVAKLGNENNTSNVFQSGDVLQPGEVLSCSACHTDADTGALRVAANEFTINLSNGATASYDIPGASGLCARCHSGRETGDSINANTKVFPAPHYFAAAGVLYNSGGYEYAGQVYDTLGSNKLLGADAQGPCVACHMSGKSHTFAAVGDATAKASFQAELNGLKTALEAKGIYYASAHPYFFTAPYNSVRGTDGNVPTNVAVTDWSLGGTSTSKDVMGAAFNYALLVNEPGAYAHNPEYALKLIADSIDFLNDGVVGP